MSLTTTPQSLSRCIDCSAHLGYFDRVGPTPVRRCEPCVRRRSNTNVITLSLLLFYLWYGKLTQAVPSFEEQLAATLATSPAAPPVPPAPAVVAAPEPAAEARPPARTRAPLRLHPRRPVSRPSSELDGLY